MTTTETQTAKAPTHIAYQVREGSKDKSYWTRIGVAWMHKDGKGFSAKLSCTPGDGNITFRVPSESK